MTDTITVNGVSKTGVIGLGSMGLPMARHMADNNFKVWGFDVNPEATAFASKFGINVCSSVEEIGQRAEVIILMVQSDEQIRQIIYQTALLEHLEEGKVLCVASSVSPLICKEIEKKTEVKGVGLIDTPVVLGQEACNNGTLTVLAGGKEKWLEKARPVLGTFSRNIFHIGETGTGQVAKTINNLLLWACITANYEVLTLAKNLDVNVDLLIEALNHSSGANWSLSRWGKSTGKWAEKDMDAAIDLAQKVGTSIPLSGLVDQLVKNLDQDKMKALLNKSYP